VASSRKSGRRAGASGTREAILAAASTLFAERGYEGTTIRAVAAEAGVDPALVHHFHGTKEALFAAATRLPYNPAEVIPTLLADGRDGAGERIVRFLLAAWDDEARRAPLLGLMRSALTHDPAGGALADFLRAGVLAPLTRALDGPDAPLRASLVVSQVAGVAIARYLVGIEPLASAPPETVVAAVAPTIQRYLPAPLEDLP
jgi:AcrR family transcriptional regulator